MSELEKYNKEIARYAAMLNKRIKRASEQWDTAGLFYQGLSKSAELSKRTNPKYNPHGIPKLTAAKQPNINVAKNLLKQYKQLAERTILTQAQANAQIDVYRQRLKDNTGINLSRPTYKLYMEAQNSAGIEHISSEQLLRFFEVIDRIPSGSRQYLPFDPSDTYSVREYLESTSLPAEKLLIYIEDEFNHSSMQRYNTDRNR